MVGVRRGAGGDGMFAWLNMFVTFGRFLYLRGMVYNLVPHGWTSQSPAKTSL